VGFKCDSLGPRRVGLNQRNVVPGWSQNSANFGNRGINLFEVFHNANGNDHVD
jgi:hypothetical protein